MAGKKHFLQLLNRPKAQAPLGDFFIQPVFPK